MASTTIPPPSQAEEVAAAQTLLESGKPSQNLEMETPIASQKEKGFIAKLKQPHIRDTIIWSAVALIVSLLYIFAFPCQPLAPKNKALNSTFNATEWNSTTIEPVIFKGNSTVTGLHTDAYQGIL